MRLVCVALLAASAVARADGEYPETAVDRPRLMYGGMTSLDVSEDFQTYTNAGATKVANALDLLLAHSFGLVQVEARVVNVAAIAGASLQVGCDGVVTGSFEWDVPQTTFAYSYAQTIAYSHRLLRIDHHFAVFAGASAYLLEASLTPSNAPATSGVLLGARASASALIAGAASA